MIRALILAMLMSKPVFVVVVGFLPILSDDVDIDTHRETDVLSFIYFISDSFIGQEEFDGVNDGIVVQCPRALL